MYRWHGFSIQCSMAGKHYTVYIDEAKQAEKDDSPEKAIELYEAAIKQDPLETFPYTRLMILYRKSKDAEKELRVINKAIKVYQEHYDEKTGRVLHNRKLEMAGRALLKSLTPAGQKPAMLYPEPIPAWIKRKSIVEKKHGKKPGKK